MKRFRDMLRTSVEAQSKLREDIEWSNFWWDDANKQSDKRICLVGDSTARMVRSALAKALKAPVDLIATSAGFHDELFVSQVDTFFTTGYQKYDAIFVQLGHHAEIGKSGGVFEECDYNTYYEDYKDFILFLQQMTNNVVVESVFYTVIPNKSPLAKVRRFFKLKEKYDESINGPKQKKNDLACEASKETGAKYLDINNYMLTKGKWYRHRDHIHFEDSAKTFIVDKMLEYL